MTNLTQKEILPYIVVYKNRFSNIQSTYEFFQTLNKDSDIVYDFKRREGAGWAQNTHMVTSLDKDIENKNGGNFISELIKIRKDVLDDYVSQYYNSKIWPLDLKDKYQNAEEHWYADFSIIKTFHNPSRSIVRHPEFHLDVIPSPKNQFDRNHIITTMIYINDEYGHGEIKFYDKDHGFLYYKPEAGDIITFPSFYPFYHNPVMPEGVDRYAIRSSFDSNIENSLLGNNQVKFEDYVDKNEYNLYLEQKIQVNYINGKDLK